MNNKKIVQNIVKFIFQWIEKCVRENKSSVKISWWNKIAISKMLSEDNLKSIDNFIDNMKDEDVKELLEGIKKEIEME